MTAWGQKPPTRPTPLNVGFRIGSRLSRDAGRLRLLTDAVEKGLDPSVVPLDADWAENSLSF
jgi:hypothetical protein